MVKVHKDQPKTGPNRAHLHRDKGVIVHRRTTEKSTEYVAKLSVKEGVRILDLLRGEEDDVLERNVTKE